MPNPWTSRTETAIHAPFLQLPRNVGRRGSPATSHVESRVSRDTDIIPYRRYGVHNNAVLDSYVYYDPVESTWFYRDRREQVDQDFLDDYFSDRQEELNYRGIFHPRIKFENDQWVPNENTAPQTTLRESNPTFDSRHNASIHEKTSSRQETSGRNLSSKSKREPTDTMSRMMAMFKTTLGSYGTDEKPRRKTDGRRLSSMLMHEAPMRGRDKTMDESTAHRAANEDRRHDLTRSRTAVVHQTIERKAEEPQPQLLPKERQPAPSTMHSTDNAGMKGRTSAPDSTQSRQSRREEGGQFRTLTDVQETKPTEGTHAAQFPLRESPPSLIANRREDPGLKGRETIPATSSWRVDGETPTRRKAELDVRPQLDAPIRSAVHEPAIANLEDLEGMKVSYDTLKRARDERDPRHEERPRQGDEDIRLQEGTMQLVTERASSSGMLSMPQTKGITDENARRQIREGNGDKHRRLHESRYDVVCERRSSNDSDDEDRRWRALQPRGDESRLLRAGLEELVIGRDVERPGARRGEYRRTAERTTNDERSRRERREGKRDESARVLETSKMLVVERGSRTTGMASDERDAGYNPASYDDVERGGENVPVSPGRTPQDDEDRRQREASGRAIGLEMIRGYAGRQVRTMDEAIDLMCKTFEFEEECRWMRARGVKLDQKWSREEYGRYIMENGVSAARMAILSPSQTILEGDVPRIQSPARSIARSNPSRGYSVPQPSRHPSACDQRDRRRSTRADESTRYSRHPERLREDVSRETRQIVSSQYSNASIGVYSPHTWGTRPQAHGHGLLQPPVPSSNVEIVDERGRNESNREQEVAVQRRGACDTSHTWSRYVGPTRASLAAHDAYWAKYSPSRAAGGKISPPATTEENEELEDVDDNNSSEAGYNSG